MTYNNGYTLTFIAIETTTDVDCLTSYDNYSLAFR